MKQWARWLWANREWVFSGVGVLIVVWGIRFLRQYIWPAGKEAQPATQVASAAALVAASATGAVGSAIAAGSNISQVVNNEIKLIAVSTRQKRIRSKPTPADISKQLAKLPPMQRDKFRAHYQGLRVSWPVRFMTATRLDRALNFVPDQQALEKIFGISDPRKGCLLMLLYGHGNTVPTPSDCVGCLVSVSDYPILNTLEENARMWVEGEIFACLDGALLLSGVVLQFL